MLIFFTILGLAAVIAIFEIGRAVGERATIIAYIIGLIITVIMVGCGLLCQVKNTQTFCEEFTHWKGNVITIDEVARPIVSENYNDSLDAKKMWLWPLYYVNSFPYYCLNELEDIEIDEKGGN